MVNLNFLDLVFMDLDVDDQTLLTIARKLTKRELSIDRVVERNDAKVVIALKSNNGRKSKKNLYLVIRKTGMPIIPVTWNITSVAPTTKNRKT